MRPIIAALVATTVLALTSMNLPADPVQSLYDLKVNSLDGKPVDLGQYKGHVVLVVNVASKCGFTPQYAGLEKLYLDYKDKGFFVLGFPANDFGHQEPGTPEEIAPFARANTTSPFRCSKKSRSSRRTPINRPFTNFSPRAFRSQPGTSANISSIPTAKC